MVKQKTPPSATVRTKAEFEECRGPALIQPGFNDLKIANHTLASVVGRGAECVDG